MTQGNTVLQNIYAGRTENIDGSRVENLCYSRCPVRNLNLEPCKKEESYPLHPICPYEFGGAEMGDVSLVRLCLFFFSSPLNNRKSSALLNKL
jgi:hypothetical protein